jgi:hypothetical protein
MTTYNLTASLSDGSSLTEPFTVTSAQVYPLFAIPNPVTNSGATSWSAITTALGAVLGERYYFTPTQNVPSAPPTPLSGVKNCIVSIRPTVTQVLSGSLDSALEALFKQVAPGDFWTCWHEGEAHVDTPADLIAVLTHCYNLFKEYAPASATFGQICMSYTAYSGSQYYPLGQWVCCPANGGAKLDWFGVDAYPVNPSSYTFAETIGPVVTAVEAVMGFTPVWGITECNIVANTGVTYTDAEQLQYFKDAWAWAVSNGCLVFDPYFGNAPDTWPPYTDVVSYLASINALAGG